MRSASGLVLLFSLSNKLPNKLSEEKGDDVFFGKCNIDQEALLQSRFDISAVPTLLFIKNGEIKNRLVGEVHPLIIQEEIKKLA